MILSKLLSKINDCCTIATTIHLSNHEERQLTLTLVKYFKQLNKYIVSRAEHRFIKQKLFAMKSPNHLTYILQRVLSTANNQPPNQLFRWIPWLDPFTNITLWFLPNNHSLTIRTLKNNLMAIYSKKASIIQQYTALYIESEHNNHSPNHIIEYCKTFKSQQVIIPSTIIRVLHAQQQLNTIMNNHIQSLTIDTICINEIPYLVTIIQSLLNDHPTKTIGLTIHLNLKQAIHSIEYTCKELLQNPRFVLRLSKGTYNSNPKNTPHSSVIYYAHQQFKMNTFFKWSVYTAFNMIRRHPCQCVIQVHNVYDLAWIMIIKRQMNINKQVKFEIEINKFPNLAKCLLLMNEPSVHCQTIFLDKHPKDIVTIILKKLIEQSRLITQFRALAIHPDTLFVKTHHRFFKYLERNYLSLLKKHQKKS